MEDLLLTTEQILERLNKGEYDDLGKFLPAIDWAQIAPETIIPRPVLRQFVRKISDGERRIEVMDFLLKFTKEYFYGSAYAMEYKIIEEENEGLNDEEIADYAKEDALEDIQEMKDELNFQIDLVKSKDYPGAVIDRLKKRKEVLEKEVKDLREENKKLSTKVDTYEHPYRHGLFIPVELQEEEFWHIMKYLQSKQIVMPYQDRNEYGLPHVACYQWCDNASKALFGYFADRVSYELDLYKDKHIQWKIFRPAFVNFKELEKQAKDVVSKYKSWANPQVPLPKGYEIIDAAIEYADEKMSGDKPAVKDHKEIGSRM